MKKKNTGKKVTVIRDELQLKGGGLYCYMPFERLDKDKKAVFKIGMAIDFNKRTEGYHTYFPEGVYMVAFLQNPPVPRDLLRSYTKEKKAKLDKGKGSMKKIHYLNIEKFVLNYVDTHGGKRIHSTTRMKNLNEENKGETEWTYTSDDVVHEAFDEAHKKYGGTLHSYYLEGVDSDTNQFTSINQIATEKERSKKSYVGKIIFQI
jgi:hypothetical protein